ncbi:MAG TPA: hypothetical protein VIC26_04175 [Marinagarivorans sp.]
MAALLGKLSAGLGAVGLAIGMMAQPAWAEMPSFNTVGAQFARQKVEGAMDSYDGYGLKLSKQWAKNFFAGGQYHNFELSNNVESEQLDLHVGLFAAVPRMNNTRIASLFGYRKASIDGPADSVSDDTGFIGVSLRNRAYERIELRADLHYLDWSKSESGFMGALGFSYFIAAGFAFEVGYKKQGDTQTFSSGFALLF